jgi:hypothetical protein
MNQKQASLTRLFLGTANEARTTGARDDDLIPALLAAAHATAMRGDPTWQRIGDMFAEAEQGERGVA